MRVIYTSKGMSKKFGVRVIYRKIRYFFTILKARTVTERGLVANGGVGRISAGTSWTSTHYSYIVEEQQRAKIRCLAKIPCTRPSPSVGCCCLGQL